MKQNAKKINLGSRLEELQVWLGVTGDVLAAQLGLSKGHYSRIKKNDTSGRIPTFWRGIRREHPEWEPYLRGRTDRPPADFAAGYEQPPEHMRTPGRGDAPEPDAGSYGIPDLSHHRLTELIQPGDTPMGRGNTHPDDAEISWYLNAVNEILRADVPGLSHALKTNIDQLTERLRDSFRLREIQTELVELRRQLKELQEKNEVKEGERCAKSTG